MQDLRITAHCVLKTAPLHLPKDNPVVDNATETLLEITDGLSRVALSSHPNGGHQAYRTAPSLWVVDAAFGIVHASSCRGQVKMSGLSTSQPL